MNIHAKKGDKVKFTNPDSGWPSDRRTANEYLEEGEIYTVEWTRAEKWRSYVRLQEVPKVTFNTVMFSDYDDQEMTVDTIISYVRARLNIQRQRLRTHNYNYQEVALAGARIEELQLLLIEIDYDTSN